MATVNSVMRDEREAFLRRQIVKIQTWLESSMEEGFAQVNINGQQVILWGLKEVNELRDRYLAELTSIETSKEQEAGLGSGHRIKIRFDNIRRPC